MTSNKDWIEILRADIVASGSIGKTAERVGVSRPTLSQILNGCGHYGSGKASTAKVEEKVMNSIGLVTCPFLTEYHGTEHRITGLECREHAYRDSPPTHVPREMQHWRACQNCEKRVKPAGIVAAFGLTALLATTSIPAWWVLPLAVAAVLWLSLRRVAR